MTMSEHARPKKSVTKLSKRVCSINDNSRQIVKRPRNMTSRSPMSSLTSTSTSSTSLRHRSSVRSLLVTSIIATVSLLGRANAGISFGGVTSTDACYSALETAAIPGENKVDKNGYVSFVNELSSDAFTSFRYNEKTDEWGMFPVVEFEELPSSIKGVFYKIACGGEYTICEEAYLYTDGIQDDTNPQDVVYLFELCTGVEDAIAEEKGDDNVATTTNGPTQTPTAEASLPTVKPTSVPGFTISTSTPTIASISEEILVLTYRAVVTDTITSSNLNDPTSAYRSQLLGAMSTWTMKTTSKVNNGSVERKRKREQQSRNNGSRELLVYSKPLVETDGTSLMDVVDVECDAENATFMTDHCIEIKNTVILEFVNESPNHNSTLNYIEDKFETDINNGEFRNLILPTSTKEEFRLLYSSTDTTSTDENAALLNPDNLIDDGDKKKTNIIAIVASSCIVLLLIGVVAGLFIHRRHNYKADKSDAVDGTSERDGRESYATPDFDTPNDLEGGEKKRDVSEIFPLAESGSDSSSMESFSGSSSDDSSTSTSGSSADDESTGSSKYRSSTSEVGSAAEVYAAHGNSRASSRSSSRSSAKDRSRASSTPTDEDSSAGSSGWESSDGSSSVDSASVESYKGDLASLKSGSTSTTPIDGSIISSTSSSQELGRVANPQENNYAMDRGVTMIRIEEESRKSVSLSSSSSPSSRSDVTPTAKSIEEAIEKGDWQAVGATAAMLASTTSIHEDDDVSDSSSGSDTNENDYESTIDSSAKSSSARTVDSDVARTAEIDKLVDSGNWNGVVAVAARYVEEAEEAEEELLRPHSGSKSNSPPIALGSAESDMDSVSIETADASTTYSNTSRSDMNDSDHGTTVSGSEMSSSSGAKTLTGSDQSSSSIPSSPSRDWRRKAAYRAEVEALIRRVVPEELSNIDNILTQFEGREKELIVTLKSMQEKSIAQRARATVQHTNTRRSSGRSSEDSNQSESIGEDYTEDDDESSRGGSTNTHSTGVSDSRESGISGGRSITSASASSLSGSSFTNQTNTTSDVSSNNPYVVAASDRSHHVGSVERGDTNSVAASSNGWSNIIATASNIQRNPVRGSSSDDID